MTGTTMEMYPRASPLMTLGAGPFLQDSASSLTGAYSLEV